MTTINDLEARLNELQARHNALSGRHDRLTEKVGKHDQELTNLQSEGAHQDNRIAGHDNKLRGLTADVNNQRENFAERLGLWAEELSKLTLTVEAWETARKLAATERRRRQVETEQPPPRLRELIEDTNEKVTLIVQATEDATTNADARLAEQVQGAQHAIAALADRDKEIERLEANATFLQRQFDSHMRLLRRREDELRAMQAERNGLSNELVKVRDRESRRELLICAGAPNHVIAGRLREIADNDRTVSLPPVEARYVARCLGAETSMGPGIETLSDVRSMLLALRDEMISWRSVDAAVAAELGGPDTMEHTLEVRLKDGAWWRLRAEPLAPADPRPRRLKG